MITELPEVWDEVVDVVVVGTGGAALVAATLAADGGAEVLVVEKDDAVGGTTGVSGGVLWIPNNHHMAEVGVADSREDALSYLRRVADGRELDPGLIEVFVDTGPEMLAYLEAKTPLRMQPVRHFPDYYFGAGLPGTKSEGRAVEPVPFAVRKELPEWADRIAARSTLLSLGASTTLTEDLLAMGGVTAHLDDLARREREGLRTKGAALVGSLLKGLVDRGVRISLSNPARELVAVDGEVFGLVVEREGRPVAIGARRGVILACGGFEWNAEMVRECIGYEVKPLSPGTNTGDGHVMAMEAGARMGLMFSYWGQGAMFDPAITRDGEPVAQMVMGVDGGIIVNQLARRFMSGGYTYNDWPKPFGRFDQDYPGYPNQPPGWVVFDDAVKRRTTILTVRPEDPAPEWMTRADTVAELAAKTGLDPASLVETIERYNAHAAQGEDPDFGRPGPPLTEPPFYALQIWPASLGTNGGCRINADGQVLGYRSGVIGGLYAAGNTSAAALGGAYVGGGTPIASGCTFGYRAGRHAAAQPPRSLER